MPPSKSAATSSAAKSAKGKPAKAGKSVSKASAKGSVKPSSKATSKSGSKPLAKAVPVKQETIPQNTVVAAAQDVTVNPVAAALESVSAAFAAAHQRHQQLSAAVSASRAELRALEKQTVRELRAAYKAAERGKRRQGNRSPSGFVKPTAISDELAKFLGKDAGTEMARTEVTRELNAYIRQHNLQDKNNGRKINADASLRSLLQLGKDDELTYFNLQKYMSPHFAKSKPTASASS